MTIPTTDSQEPSAAIEPPPEPGHLLPKKRRKGGRFVFFLLFLFMATASLYLLAETSSLHEEKTVIIPRKTSVQEIASILAREDVVIDKILFYIASRLLAENSLKAGEYKFEPGQTLLSVIKQMKEGKTVTRKFTVPEGLTSHEIMVLLRDDSSLTGEIDTPPEEGSLLPETYHYNYGDLRSSILERMQKAQQSLLVTLWEERAPDLPLSSLKEAIILASIVEKETGKKASERPQVAGVFINRLRIGMRLQSDPTVIYGMTNGLRPLGRDLTRADLLAQTAYNTYTNAGLPPQPISNPGEASLRAVLHPDKNNYLYFVADGTGGHAFASTLDEHNRNVVNWLKLLHP